jgi:hypothetical protein
VDDRTIFRRRFEDQWPRWLDRELGPDARRPKQWRGLLRKVELRQLQDLAEGVCSFAIPPEREGGRKMLQHTVKELSERFPKVAAALAGKEKPKNAPSKAEPLEKSAYKLASDLAKVDEDLVAKAVALVDDFAREFRRDYVRAGFVSFDGILSLVHDLFNDDRFRNVLELLRDRYQCILVDEFQDTDPVQGQIIQKLAEGPDGKLVPGKLFLVGDAKQSIYSFRGADIIAYRTLAERILREGGDPVVLRTNFRSHGKILDFVNAAFSRLIVENKKLQDRYEPIEPAVDAVQKYPDPTLEAILIEEASADESREVEAVEDRPVDPGPPRDFVPRDRDPLPLADGRADVPRGAAVARTLTSSRAKSTLQHGRGGRLRQPAPGRGEPARPGRARGSAARSPYGGLSDQELYDRRKSLDYRIGKDVPLFRFLRRWNGMAGTVGVGS